MKHHEVLEVYLHSLLTLALDVGERSASCRGCLPMGKELLYPLSRMLCGSQSCCQELSIIPQLQRGTTVVGWAWKTPLFWMVLGNCKITLKCYDDGCQKLMRVFCLAAATVSPTGAEHAATGSCTWPTTKCWGTATTIWWCLLLWLPQLVSLN